MIAMPRALRHLAITLALWIGGRTLILALPVPPPGEAPHAMRNTVPVAQAGGSSGYFLAAFLLSPSADSQSRALPVTESGAGGDASLPRIAARPTVIDDLEENPVRRSTAPKLVRAAFHIPNAKPRWIGESGDMPRLSLSAWSIYRPETGVPRLSPSGQLGGSQIGIRVQRRLIDSGRRLSLSLNLRASAPLKGRRGKEAALGVSARRAGRVALELLVERRAGLDGGGRDAFAALAATGFDDFRLPGKVLLSGYGQAGVVGARKRDGFVDGAVRVERDAGAIGGANVRIGVVLAGAKQPGVSRLDIGPSAALRFRIGRAGGRIGGEWRYRIAGAARPGSGPAITLGLDY